MGNIMVEEEPKLPKAIEMVDSTSASNSSPVDSPPTSPTISRKNTHDVVLEEWNKNDKSRQEKKDIERIIKLHNLIKKQTILVFIAVLTDILFYVAVISNHFFRSLNGFDYAMNAICIWMMLGTSKPYWDFCKKNGICACCYCKTNKLGL